MTIPIRMPALSPTMTEGTIAKWLKREGDPVKSGDVLAEIETDKATMEVEAADEGVLGRIVVPAGKSPVPVNEVIAVLLEEGEDVSALQAAPPAPVSAKPAATPKAGSAPAPMPAAPAARRPTAEAAPPTGTRIFASPLARRLAKDAGIDLGRIAGSGPHGRIVKSDVEAARAGGGAVRLPAQRTAAPQALALSSARQFVSEAGLPPFHEVPLTSMRKVIAKRLTEAKQQIPHFYLTVDCEIDKLLGLRQDLNGRSNSYKLSVNDFVIRASALALKKVPAANAMWTETAIRIFGRSDISVAVATEGGLITPVIRGADGMGLAEISNAAKALAEKARKGKLVPEEYQGGTFTISNLGMFGIKEFAAIINPPQGCILAVGAGTQRPVVKEGALAIATVMTCTLSTDHRVVDGAIGAAFMNAFKGYIEDPLTMLL